MPGKLVSRMSERGCHTLNETDTIKKASQELSEKKIGCMPVLDKNKSVIGIISERDLSQFIYKERFNLNTSVTELMDEMTEKKIRHILIMENKKLLGIVSIGDVVNHLIAKVKEENKNLRDYINSY